MTQSIGTHTHSTCSHRSGFVRTCEWPTAHVRPNRTCVLLSTRVRRAHASLQPHPSAPQARRSHTGSLLLRGGLPVRCAGPSSMRVAHIVGLLRLRAEKGRVLGIREKVETWRLASALVERTDVHGSVCQRNAPPLLVDRDGHERETRAPGACRPWASQICILMGRTYGERGSAIRAVPHHIKTGDAMRITTSCHDARVAKRGPAGEWHRTSHPRTPIRERACLS